MSVPSAIVSVELSAVEDKGCGISDLQKQQSRLKVFALIVCSLIPFWSIPASHFLSSPETATGFFHYELPYYVANGRAAFERGNGFMYPNPYDPSAESPSIYFHWLPWTLGLLTSQLGCDPGHVTLALTFFASLAFAWATYRLVVHRVVSQRNQSIAFLLAMWGGGCLAVLGTAVSLWSGRPWIESVLRFDPENGFWFLNWGRNAVFPTEAIYHTLVAFCWLSEIRRKAILANVWLLLLATTHPWSGLELLLTINLWRLLQFTVLVISSRSAAVQSKNNDDSTGEKLNQQRASSAADVSQNTAVPSIAFARNQLALSVAVLVVFLGYYKVWLPSFAQHAQLQGVWELNWSVSSMTAVLAYSLVLGFAFGTLLRFRQWSTTEQFLMCALMVATGLAFHDRVIKPVQPIHFTRGYIWMPLFLLGLPAIVRWFDEQRNSASKLSWLASVLFICFVLDNASFAFVHANRQYQQKDGFHLDDSERALFAVLKSSESVRGQIVISDSGQMNYLLPTFTEMRPWLGHLYNTPDFRNRRSTWEQCFEKNQVQPEMIPADVDVVITRQGRDQSKLALHPEWQAVQVDQLSWSIWRRMK